MKYKLYKIEKHVGFEGTKNPEFIANVAATSLKECNNIVEAIEARVCKSSDILAFDHEFLTMQYIGSLNNIKRRYNEQKKN